MASQQTCKRDTQMFGLSKAQTFVLNFFAIFWAKEFKLMASWSRRIPHHRVHTITNKIKIYVGSMQ
ncbi:hypothetical protein BpHYR1_022885 [Brachionus plicatilis]|uniref:Uncharacterized protein n=1 Tax=Brachionus plicatilis TaxID=10195 RepID=A0A3M7Q6M9_BRAPC|nr:hypothetical protein BpHYR1_022885 [Brachionus plicatilis]